MLKCTAVKGERTAAVKVVLAGNPNAGKTTLFNALTGSRLRTGNYHGVTTAAFSATVGGTTYTDVPGMYAFNAYTMEESEAYSAIEQADIIVNVVDALTLESSAELTRRLIALGKPTIIYVTKLPALRARKGFLDEKLLSAHFGVPVTGSVKRLRQLLSEGGFKLAPAQQKIQLDKAYYGGNCNITAAEKLIYNRIFAPVLFVLSLTLTFFITFFPGMPGEALKSLVERLIFVDLYNATAANISNPVAASLVGEGVIGGIGGVLSFIPQIAILYLCLVLLDESGVSSALSFVTDGLFEKVGLSGKAAFSLVSGFGCTAAAIATTRGFSLDRSRRKTVAVLPYIPCGAKMPVFLTLLSPLTKNPFPAVCVLYFGGILLAVGLSALLKGGREGLICEVTPISLPAPTVVIKKLSFYLQSFIIKVTTYVFVFCLISWLLSHFSPSFEYCEADESMLGGLSRAILPIFMPMGITDWRYAYALISGFAAKENIAATLGMLLPQGVYLTLPATAAVCVFVLTCPACISAFASSVREVGLKTTLKFNAAQLSFAFVAAYLTYFIARLL